MIKIARLSAFASALLLFAGAACAEQRYFEFTGTVTRSEDPTIAEVGSTIRGTFHYDDAMPGDHIQDTIALYDPDTELTAEVDGHTLMTDRTWIMIHDYPDSAADMFDLHSTPGIMIDDTFLADAFFGFRLMGSGLQSRRLPSAFDLDQFHYAAGEVMLDGYGSVLAEFSIDSLSLCLKKNGKPDKHCKRGRE